MATKPRGGRATKKITFFAASLNALTCCSKDHAWYDEQEDENTDWKENVVREAPLGNYAMMQEQSPIC